MVAGSYYQFVNADCTTTTGQLLSIPDGSHMVAEMGVVTITVLPGTITLSVAEFSRLKLEKKAIPL